MRTSHRVDLRFLNTPSVTAEVDVTDPVSGDVSSVALHFVDDEARAICEMVPNPNGDGTVATGNVDLAELDDAIARRLDLAPQRFATLIADAETARRTIRDAQAAKAMADAAKDTAVIEADAASARRDAAETEEVRLNTNVATLRQQKADLESAIGALLAPDRRVG